jgi:exonuclease SbcC
MKILRLEVLNLASLAAYQGQPQVVDFSVEPLLSAGLSAITGPTGAGKSTLLDALCLALFDEVPRLRSASIGQEGKLPEIGQSLAFGDKRNLLSRGSTHGFAAVEFLGIDGQRYLAKWEVQRARKRLDGAIQKVSRSLKNLSTDQVLATQKSECAALVPELIGMNFEQFTRAVLLAQTEFGAFLKAGDLERAQLLECLTDTGIYSKLGILAFQQYKDAKARFDQLQAEHGFIQALDTDARAQLDQQVSAQLQHKTQLTQQIEQMRQAAHWLGEQQRYQHDLHEARHVEQQIQSQWQESQPIRQAIQDYETLTPYRQYQQQRQQLEQQLQISTTRRDERQQAQRHAQTLLAQATEALVHQQQRAATLKQQQQQEHTWLMLAKPIELELAHRRQLYSEHKQRLNSLDAQAQPKQAQHRESVEQLQQLDQQLQQIRTQLGQHDAWSTVETRSSTLQQQAEQWQHAQEEQQRFERRLDEKQHALNQAQAQLKHAHHALVEQQNSCGDLATQQHNLNALSQQMEQIQAQLQLLQPQLMFAEQQAPLLTELTEQQQRVTQLQIDCRHAEQAYQQQVQIFAVVERLYQQQQQRHDEWVIQLRRQLTDDQPCPVCGSLLHPFTEHPDQLSARLLTDTEQQYRTQQQQLAESLAAYQTLDHHYQLATKHHAWLTSQYQHLTARYPQYVEQTLCADQLRQQIATLTSDLATQQQRYDQGVARREQTQQLQYQWQQQHDKVQLLTTQLADHQTLDAQLRERVSAQIAFVTQLLPLDLQKDWQHADQTIQQQQLQTWIEVLAERERHHQQLQLLEKQQQQISQQHERLSQELQHLSEKTEEIKQLLAQQKIDGQLSKQKLDQYLNFAVPPVESTAAWELQLETQRQQMHTALQHAEQQYYQADKDRHGHERALAEQQQRHQDLEQSLAALDQQIDEWRQAHPQFDDTLLAERLSISESDHQQQQQMLAALQQQLLRQQSNLAQLEQQLTRWEAARPADLAATVTPDQIEQQQQALQQQLADAEQHWAHLYGQQVEDDRKQQHAHSLQDAMASAQQVYHRWAKIVEPIGCSTGAKFRKIAQSYQLDVLLQYANQQLKQLSPRYRLQRASDSLGLLVIDQDMANEQRSVHSLSGGESFLMSLALALGLAQMASGQVKIESLFIDEGFGTLDPESLQLVMDALDQLQSQGRKVIVITHVQEMQERIPTQIKVQRLGAGRSHIVITPSVQNGKTP